MYHQHQAYHAAKNVLGLLLLGSGQKLSGRKGGLQIMGGGS